MQKPSAGRIAAVVVASLLFGCGIGSCVQASRRHRIVSQWERTVPLSLAVDFSRPTACEASFAIGNVQSHYDFLQLRVDGPDGQPRPPDDVLDGLKGWVSIVGPHGQTVVDDALDQMDWFGFPMDGYPCLLRLRGISAGDYHLTLRIDAGNPKLASLPQRLELHHRYCGMEYFSSVIAALTGLVCLIAGVLVIGIAGWLSRRRARLKHAAGTPQCTPDSPSAPGSATG